MVDRARGSFHEIHVLNKFAPGDSRKPKFAGSTKDKFFDDFEVVEKEEVSGGWGRGNSRVDDICAPSSSNKSAWEQVTGGL